MSLSLQIANRLILANTQHHIDPEDRQRIAIDCANDEIEAWITKSDSPPPNMLCLKFPGTGGRAERAGPHPCEIVSRERYEVWTINPPGYGTSTGAACVTKMAATCESAWQAINARANGKPIIVTGNSLGGIYALYVAARYPVAGILLRNPAPIHQLIRGRYSWWNVGMAPRLIGNQVPSEMDAVKNASLCTSPALFVTSDKDRKIPPRYQQMIFDAYGGESSLFTIDDADHHTPISEDQAEEYQTAVETWGQQIN